MQKKLATRLRLTISPCFSNPCPPSQALHRIEIPASLAHRLTDDQRTQLETYASTHEDSRKKIVAIEHAMASGKPFDDALKAAKETESGK